MIERFRRLTPRRIRAVVRWELEWLAGWHLPPRVYRVLYWFNPFAWLAEFAYVCDTLGEVEY